MKLSALEISTCSTCGAALEETSNADLGCMVCLLRVGLGGDQVGEDLPVAANDRFGIYVIERHDDGSLHELGRGAMGVTFCAIDTSLQRKVALKIIKTDLAARSAEARERFMREARAAAALRHENVATVYQFGVREETGQCFYAMELIEGETIEEHVRRSGPLDVPTTIAIAQQVAAALTAAEKRGLIHRDLKPANLMLVSTDDEDQTQDRHRKPLVKVIDFGVAKALKDETDPMSLTRDGFVGTPAFASPEQFGNAPLDVRSDIYSLGLTLWFALTGKSPFQGRNVEGIQRAQQSVALPVEQLKTARVPSRLIVLLESMLAFEPAARPGTQELAARLQRCSMSARRSGKLIAFSLAAGVLVLGAVAFWGQRPWHNRNPGPNRHTADAEATTNPAAYQAFLKGRYFWNRRTVEGFKVAEDYFNKAIALDPKYAQAYAGLGDTYQLRVGEDWNSRSDAFAKSKNANRKALELDPTLAEAHASVALAAMNYDWDWPTAEQEFRRALALNPSYTTAHHWYAEYLVAVGRFDESLREIERARELDPLSIIINNDAGKILLYARRLEEAKEQLNETLKMDPNFAQAHWYLGWVNAAQKHYGEAIAEFKETGRLGFPTGGWAGCGYIYGILHRKNEAAQMLDALKQLSMQRPIDGQWAAVIYIGLGDKDLAFASLEEQYKTHSTGLTSLKVHPVYDSLRSDARFVDLMRRVHFMP
jgi:tetratricopeptide (TPR) repeat protein